MQLALTIPFLPTDAITAHLEAHTLRLSDIERLEVVTYLERGILGGDQVGQEVWRRVPISCLVATSWGIGIELTESLKRRRNPLPVSQLLNM